MLSVAPCSGHSPTQPVPQTRLSSTQGRHGTGPSVGLGTTRESPLTVGGRVLERKSSTRRSNWRHKPCARVQRVRSAGWAQWPEDPTLPGPLHPPTLISLTGASLTRGFCESLQPAEAAGRDGKEPPNTEALSSRTQWARPLSLLRRMSESEKSEQRLGEAGDTEICAGGITYSESQLAKANLEATGKPHCE